MGGTTQTYYHKLLQVLTDHPMDIPTIAMLLDLPETKTIYIIQAIKKGIPRGTIVQHKTAGNQRKYLGHMYSKWNETELENK
jgi:hypothetical protein